MRSADYQSISGARPEWRCTFGYQYAHVLFPRAGDAWGLYSSLHIMCHRCTLVAICVLRKIFGVEIFGGGCFQLLAAPVEDMGGRVWVLLCFVLLDARRAMNALRIDVLRG